MLSRYGARYTPEEDAVLVRLWPTGVCWNNILKHLPGRSYASVRRRAVRLGLRRPQDQEPKGWHESVAKVPGDPDFGVLPKEIVEIFSNHA